MVWHADFGLLVAGRGSRVALNQFAPVDQTATDWKTPVCVLLFTVLVVYFTLGIKSVSCFSIVIERCLSNVLLMVQASNYESLYEPIQPRNHHHSPAGSMSSLTRPSHYTTSPYPPYGGSGSSTSYGGSVGGGSVAAAAAMKPQPGHANKGATSPVQEEEVDALTNLLVQSMDNAADPEFFG